jgi:hypothetical protein
MQARCTKCRFLSNMVASRASKQLHKTANHAILLKCSFVRG